MLLPSWVGWVGASSRETATALRWLPVNIMFVLMLATSFMSLKVLPIAGGGWAVGCGLV